MIAECLIAARSRSALRTTMARGGGRHDRQTILIAPWRERGRRGVRARTRVSGRSRGLAQLGLVHPEVEEGGKGGGKVLEEGGLVLGVQLHVGPELVVLDEGHVGGEHHELAGGVLTAWARPTCARSSSQASRSPCSAGRSTGWTWWWEQSSTGLRSRSGRCGSGRGCVRRTGPRSPGR